MIQDMLSQRAQTALAVLAGVLIGAVAAWVDAQSELPAKPASRPAAASGHARKVTLAKQQRPALPQPPAQPSRAEATKVESLQSALLPQAPSQAPSATEQPPGGGPRAHASATAPVGGVGRSLPERPRRTPVGGESSEQAPDTVRSPHELVIGSEPELRRAEVRCDRLDANECMRVADAYESGKVVQANSEQVARYRKISLTLYVHQSQNGDAVACFQLARLYQTGELVTKNRENAQVLLQRCGELCARKNDEACRYIRKRAGADKPANRHE